MIRVSPVAVVLVITLGISRWSERRAGAVVRTRVAIGRLVEVVLAILESPVGLGFDKIIIDQALPDVKGFLRVFENNFVAR